jgi:putative MATE family efflux protein
MVRQLLVWMSSPTDVIDLATIYLRIYFFGMPANLLYNFGAAILRAQGDTRRPLYYLTTAGIVNVVLNLVFVIGFHLDVAGVALATIISQYISATLVIRCLTKERGSLHLNLKLLQLEWPVIRRILQVGLPAGFQGVLFSLSNVVIQSSLNSFDDAVIVAGSAASSNIENFVYAAMNAFYQAAITFVGQNYGAGLVKRVDKVGAECMAFVAVTGLVLGNLAYYFGRTLVSIYAPGEPEVVEQALVRMGFIACTYCLCGMMDTMVGVLRGLGYSVVPMVVSLLGACVLRLAWVATVFQTYRTPAALYVSYPISWAVTLTVHIIFFFAIRKRAYAKVQSNGPSYLATEGEHPVVEKKSEV